MLSSPALVRLAITNSGLTTSTSWSVWMSPAVTGPGPFLCSRSSAVLRACMRSATDFRFSRMSTTSSCTPSMLVYSCSTPSISTSVMAAPGIEDSSTRRSALPSVWPNPRSNGSITTRAWRGATGCTLTTRGFKNSETDACIRLHPKLKMNVSMHCYAARHNSGLLRIQLHDQVLVDVRQHLIAPRHRLEHAAKFLVADLDPLGKADLGRHRQRALNAQLLARLLADLDHLAGLDLIRRNGHYLAVDVDRLVGNQLARLGARGGKTHPVHHVVEPAFEQLEQRLAGGAGSARRRLVVVAELALEHAIHAAQLLLLAQLQTVVGQPLPPLALDAAGGHLQLALALERLGAALEEQIRTLAPRELAGWTEITRHGSLLPSPPLDATLLGGTAAVVRDRRDVRNARDLQATGVERAHRRLAPRTGTGDTDLDVLHAVLLSGGAGLLGRHLGRKRRALARTTKTTAAGGRPGQRIALPIGDRDDRVIERCMHVSDLVQHVLARLLWPFLPAWRALLLWFLISHRCGCLCAFSRSKTACEAVGAL